MTCTLYETGFAQRYSMHPILARYGQTLGHHQWGVTVLLFRLFGDRVDIAVAWEALHHDTGEPGGAGDVSYPAKQSNPALAEAVAEAEAAYRVELGVCEAVLTGEEQDMLSLCDRLESLLYVSVVEPRLLRRAAWQRMAADVKGLAWRLGVGAEVEGLLTEAGL